MKKYIAIALVTVISSCSLFKKTEKEQHNSLEQNQTGSQTLTTEVDTSKKQISELWKFRIPVYLGNSPKSFTPTPEQPDTSKHDPNYYSDLLGKNKEMAGTIGDMAGAIGWMEAELSRFTNQQNGLSKQQSTKDTTSSKKEVADMVTKQQPAIAWWMIFLIVIGAIVGYDAVKAVFTRILLKK